MILLSQSSLLGPVSFFISLFTFFCTVVSDSPASLIPRRGSLEHPVMHSHTAASPRSQVNGETTLAIRGFTSHIDNDAVFSTNQVLAIQVSACVLAGISLALSLLALFWFCRMKQKFRHRLIMLLVCADVVRSFWLFLFPVVTFARGPIASSSKFCQASGYLTQTGIEGADFAILFISIHTALQVFRPPVTRSGIEEGGLYQYRYLVYLIFVCLPPFLASLPFTRSATEGYESIGPFCTLPLRPFWYRLATSWIPRYVIMMIVLGLAIAIYVHVAIEFRVIGWLRHSTPSSTGNETTLQSSTSAGDATIDTSSPVDSAAQSHRKYSIPPRRPSSSALVGILQYKNSDSHPSTVDKVPESVQRRRSGDVTGSVQCSPLSPSFGQSGPEMSGDGCLDHLAESRYHEFTQSSKASQGTLAKSRTRTAETADQGKSKEMRERHKAVQRQLRHLFIYPCCYFLIWLLPFVYNLMNYSNYYAQHPIFELILLSTVCISSMGTVDAVIFTMREKPWRNLSGNDRTLFGSLACWHRASLAAKTKSKTVGNEGQYSWPTINSLGASAVGESKSESPLRIPAISKDSAQSNGLESTLQVGTGAEPTTETKSLDEGQRRRENADRHWFDKLADGM